MWKTVVALTLFGAIRVAHAQMPERTVEEPAPVVEPPPAPAQAGDTDSSAIRPPSSYTPVPAPMRDPDSEAEKKTPPLSGARIAGEVLLGGLSGVGGAVVGAYVGYGIATISGCDPEVCNSQGIIIGGAL